MDTLHLRNVFHENPITISFVDSGIGGLVFAMESIIKMREILNKFKCKVKFINHNDDNTIHKWYGLIGFKRVDNYWVREATI